MIDYENYLNYAMQVARMKAERAGVKLYPDYPTTPQVGGAVPHPGGGGGGGGGGGARRGAGCRRYDPRDWALNRMIDQPTADGPVGKFSDSAARNSSQR